MLTHCLELKTTWLLFLNPVSGEWIQAGSHLPRKSGEDRFSFPHGVILIPLYGPATFQWLMELCLGDLNHECLLIYLDDVIIFSSFLEEHVQQVATDFRRTRVETETPQ